MGTEELELDKISRMLERGATMLSQHCQTCGSPLFRYQGEIICPICQGRDESTAEYPQPKQHQETTDIQYQEQTSKENSESEQVFSEQERPETDKSMHTPVSTGSDVQYTRDLVLKKVNDIAQMMQDENDTRRVFEYFDIIERGLEIVEKIDRNR
ncbi:MAG: Sjogren's syndrome/scleroderma autoantigen 1 family protein [Methanohalobium sp.]|uniref:Sjogren's syndrome/scleroderma autoantigen 1 family protein n=1 Tax=Methanohalobium sp. TaxID=2837493 RepID=UPI00397DDD44